MTAFILALAIGLAVAVVYVWLAAANVLKVRDRVLAGDPPPDDPAVYDGQSDGFTVKAGIGAIASVAVLVGVSTWAEFWYVVPFLAIGSALAVVVAFVTDRGAA